MDPIDTECCKAIRMWGVDMIRNHNSGHPGCLLGFAPAMHALWSRFLAHTPADPLWMGRDHFIMSNGHASALYYSMLHLTGFITAQDCKDFREIHCKTSGHPEATLIDGVDVTTGPLGQGIANAVGMAMAQKHIKGLFSKPGFEHLFDDHYIYVVTGDACLQEGVFCEAAPLAGHHKLGNLIVLWDDNHVTDDGFTHEIFTENVFMRLEAQGWHCQKVENGMTDIRGIEQAIKNAQQVKDKPSIIDICTIIGYGLPKENDRWSHGHPPQPAEVEIMRERHGITWEERFYIPPVVADHYEKVKAASQKNRDDWMALFAKYKAAYPAEYNEYERRRKRELPVGWETALLDFSKDPAKSSRIWSEALQNSLAKKIPELLSLSADLHQSCNSVLKDMGIFQPDCLTGRNVKCGIREHGMQAIANGMSAYGMVIPYTSTFMMFALTYALPSVRMAAMSEHHTFQIMTHDSVMLAQDGPTHIPSETHTIGRCLPNYYLFRPCDGAETAGAFRMMLKLNKSPSGVALTRQPVPMISESDMLAVEKGAYVIFENSKETPELIFATSGSEVHLCVDVAKKSKRRMRVVSIPCLALMRKQGVAFVKQLFPSDIPVLHVEATSPVGMEWLYHNKGDTISVDRFGLSGTLSQVKDFFGYTVENVEKKANEVLSKQ